MGEDAQGSGSWLGRWWGVPAGILLVIAGFATSWAADQAIPRGSYTYSSTTPTPGFIVAGRLGGVLMLLGLAAIVATIAWRMIAVVRRAGRSR